MNNKINQGGIMKVLDFYADWCGPCQMLKPILEEVEKEHPDVEFVKVTQGASIPDRVCSACRLVTQAAAPAGSLSRRSGRPAEEPSSKAPW